MRKRVTNKQTKEKYQFEQLPVQFYATGLTYEVRENLGERVETRPRTSVTIKGEAFLPKKDSQSVFQPDQFTFQVFGKPELITARFNLEIFSDERSTDFDLIQEIRTKNALEGNENRALFEEVLEFEKNLNLKQPTAVLSYENWDDLDDISLSSRLASSWLLSLRLPVSNLLDVVGTLRAQPSASLKLFIEFVPLIAKDEITVQEYVVLDNHAFGYVEQIAISNENLEFEKGFTLKLVDWQKHENEQKKTKPARWAVSLLMLGLIALFYEDLINSELSNLLVILAPFILMGLGGLLGLVLVVWLVKRIWNAV